MARTWKQRDSKRFAKDVKLGKTYYYVQEHRVTCPGDDRFTYSEVTFTARLPLTGTPCTASGYSAATMCLNFGPMYDAPPSGMRNIKDPVPQVDGPVVDDVPGYSRPVGGGWF